MFLDTHREKQVNNDNTWCCYKTERLLASIMTVNARDKARNTIEEDEDNSLRSCRYGNAKG